MQSNPLGHVETKVMAVEDNPGGFELSSGRALGPVELAYETYGSLNADATNAILVCHALSGDAHAAGTQPGEKRAGWWDAMIGPGKAFDTDRYFVICSNVLGGCNGSTGPSSICPDSGKPYGMEFPVITIADMVRAQVRLIDALGINVLHCVAGGSMGGMQALEWASSHPHRLRAVIPLATALKHSPQQIAFNEVVRQSIMSDPAWRGGDYYEFGQPKSGLAVARMIGHITFMSERSMEEKFSRRLKGGNLSFDFATDFEVEGYLRYRGESFVERFDANSYLYITKAMDYADLSDGFRYEGPETPKPRFLVISFSSDWLYPPAQSRDIVDLLKKRRLPASYCELKSDYGHDAFLLEVEDVSRLVKGFLGNL